MEKIDTDYKRRIEKLGLNFSICANRDVAPLYHYKRQNIPQAISELPRASVSKRVLGQNLSYENDFDLHENKPVSEMAHWNVKRTKTISIQVKK